MAQAENVPAPLTHEQIVKTFRDNVKPLDQPGEFLGMYVVTGIDPLQSQTAIEVARLTSERPAEEETKRERIRQRWETLRLSIGEGKVYFVLVGMGALTWCNFSKTGEPNMMLILLIVLILGADRAGLADLIKQMLKRWGLIT